MFSKSKSNYLLIKGLIFIFCNFCNSPANAKEGMWIPATLKAHEKDMRSMGLQIPVEQLYNKDGTGMNNAVVLFGRGCTGEVISPQGLVLTNHHCGYGSVQGLSSTEHDYFADGFFAKNINEELPVNGLTVTFIRRIENVTDRILAGIDNTLKGAIRDSIIARRITAAEKDIKASTKMDAMIKPYFEGNQYWVAIAETYRDIRLVGFPPNGIGAFGGDVENWMWPRHTGDFSMFRIYADADNKPAGYSKNNKPYRADQYFKINAGGYKEGDFTLVYGFPGTTQEYISSYELKQVYNITDPISIDARTRKLDVWTKHMNASRDIFIKYTSKRAGVANGWKKWQGEVLGLKLNNATGKKEQFEKAFQKWADTSKEYPLAKTILPQMKEAASNIDPLITLDQYNKEAVLGIELIQQGAELGKLLNCFRLNLDERALRDTLTKVVNSMDGFFKNYDAATDKDVFMTLMVLYFNKCDETLPPMFESEYKAYGQDMKPWAQDVYSNTLLTSKEKLMSVITKATAADSAAIIRDPAWQLYNAMNDHRKTILPQLSAYYTRMKYLNRLYTQAQMGMNKKKIFYPNANLTLRTTYGQVKGLDPDGPAKYSFQTTLGEAVALDDTTQEIFTVPKKLKELYKKKDYGRWGVNGTMPLAFVASNHTSGGNSGSPVLNAKGELIGTNFDRAYEGTMSDYYFDPNRCRNISVDIRYTLFIVEKFGDAGWLIDEMKIVGK
ncbi:MAG: peptidase [Flavipsychrobacter sp.]|jgi:hypothetical protein|nr:peptidase [Flavipsychrobacter sp.]